MTCTLSFAFLLTTPRRGNNDDDGRSDTHDVAALLFGGPLLLRRPARRFSAPACRPDLSARLAAPTGGEQVDVIVSGDTPPCSCPWHAPG
jgi:hypothetical protein